jgi:hypothetical protein
MDVDRLGRYTAHATLSVGGQVQDIDFPGQIQVNADCTATDTYTLGPVEGTDRLVILDNGNEMQAMPTKHPLGPVTGRAYFRRIARGNREPRCTTAMVRGVYGGTGEGTMMIPVAGQPQPVPTPFSGIFSMAFHGRGTGSGTVTTSLGGNVFDLEFPVMSMEVNPDCTATLEWTAVSTQMPGQTFTGTVKYIVLDHGDELMGLEIKDSIGLPIEVENHKRISMAPAAPFR